MATNCPGSSPLVSVVLPVYNEELFIRETLEGILNQDYENLEIIISDNHSLDDTARFCRDFARRDQRIQFFQQSSNIGATPNAGFVTHKAKGKYIILTAGHDKWSTNYISANVKALENHPTAVLSYGTPCWIDEKGLPFERFSGWFDTRGLTVVSRFFFVFWGKPNPILGLIRRDIFPDLINYNFVGADNVILCQLALEGEFIHTVSTMFYRRQNRPPENHEERLKRYVSDEMKISNSFFTSLFPLLRMPIELLKDVIVSPLSLANKSMILFLLLTVIPFKYISEKSGTRTTKS
jgi:glycosyltransferase involved in cell wall biosynthesis